MESLFVLHRKVWSWSWALQFYNVAPHSCSGCCLVTDDAVFPDCIRASVVLWYVWDNPLISGHQWLWCCFSYKKLKHLKLWVCSNWFRYINIRKTYLLVVTNKFQQLLSSSGAGFDKYTLNAVYPFFFPLHQYFQAICDNWCANLTFKGTNICYSISTWNTFK